MNDTLKFILSWMFIGFLAGTLGIGFASAVKAETLSWKPPTTRVDGTPLDPVSELSEYRLYCDSVTTVLPATSPDTNTYAIKKFEALPDYGTWDCYLTAVDTEGLESAPSDVVTIPYEKTAPSNPINLIILE